MVERVEQRRVVARKEHWCRECHTKIEVGQEHYDDVLKDGEVYHWRAHVDCLDCAFAVDASKGFSLSADGRLPLIEDEEFRDNLDAWADKFPGVVARFRK